MTNQVTTTVEQLAEINKYNNNYVAYYNAPLNMKKVERDFELLQEFSKAHKSRNSANQPRLGDCLLLPDGQKVYFCHVWDDHVQTCGGGSYHLSNGGGMDFSGGLDDGLKISEIELTNEFDALPIWFSHEGRLRAHCAIHANIEVRVWKPKQGADLSGVPQIERLRKQKLKEQSEKQMFVTGNGVEYFEYLPSVYINENAITTDQLKTIEKETGLTFEKAMYYNPCYWVQPMTLKQIEKLKSYDFMKVEEDRVFTTHESILVVRKKEKAQNKR
ncbi:hypothetical protein [Sphingobacterium detergens]|uniref:hypothetical protein n=1 Tax=Sphingobacterium detergens TaxID=1145106 RepID=UPI003AB0D883